MSREGQLRTTHRRRKGKINFLIDPRSGDKAGRFLACVWIGGKSKRGFNSTTCMSGKNPRVALAAALRSLAKSKIEARTRGAFKGRK